LQLVALCDLDHRKAEARAAEYNVSGIYTDHAAMCENEQLDAVLVAIGPRAHYELALDLVERGYHVWTEKPCAENADQADAVARAAARARRLVQTGFNYRYTLGIQKAKARIDSGLFATPGLVAVHWWLGMPDPIPFMHHHMVHAVDLLHYLTPGELTDMQVRHHVRDGFDYYLATFRGGDGRIAELELTANMNGAGHWSRVDWLSKDGMLSVRDFTEVTHFGTARPGKYARPGDPPYDGDHVWRTEPLIAKGKFVDIWGYVTELDRFRQAVLGLAPPECTIAEAAWGLRMCEDMLRRRSA
jgi:myo-inositol 2-dehydrogenase/D-chiro-inositol 1-dehydrogenase